MTQTQARLITVIPEDFGLEGVTLFFLELLS